MQTKDKELILLSFDTEEFDVPREHGVNISLEEGMRVSVEGTTRILDCLKRNGVCATFFCTGNFAEQAPRLIRRIMDEGHEVACHGVDHWKPVPEDVWCSKNILERVAGVPMHGYRQPRMFPVSDDALAEAGYSKAMSTRVSKIFGPIIPQKRISSSTKTNIKSKGGDVFDVVQTISPFNLFFPFVRLSSVCS